MHHDHPSNYDVDWCTILDIPKRRLSHDEQSRRDRNGAFLLDLLRVFRQHASPVMQGMGPVHLGRARFYAYLDLKQSPDDCDLFLRFIAYHPLFVVKPFGMIQREVFTMGRPLGIHHYGMSPTQQIHHVFDVEFVGDRRIATMLRHPFFRDSDGDTAIIRRVFGFIQTQRRSTPDGIEILWPTR